MEIDNLKNKNSELEAEAKDVEVVKQRKIGRTVKIAIAAGVIGAIGVTGWAITKKMDQDYAKSTAEEAQACIKKIKKKIDSDCKQITDSGKDECIYRICPIKKVADEAAKNIENKDYLELY